MPRGSERRWEIPVIYVVASVIAGVLLFAFVVRPEQKRYNDAVEDYNSQQQRNLRATDERDALVEEYVRLKEKADSTEKLLFENERDADIFLEELPKMSEKRGNIILTSMAPGGSTPMASPNPTPPKKGEEAEPSPLTKVAAKPVGLNIVGGYGDMIGLFGDFEEYKRLMNISQVSVGGARGERSDVNVNFSLSLIHSRAGAARTPEEEKIAQIVKSVVQDAKAAQTQVVKVTGRKPPIENLEPRTPTRPRPIVRPPGRDENVPYNIPGGPGATGSREGSTEREQKPGWRSVKYSFHVTVPGIEEGRTELEALLRSMNYEPWVWSGLAKGTAPYPLFVGKFDTKDEAYAFGKLVQERMPSIEGFGVKRVILDYDSVLKETRVEVED